MIVSNTGQPEPDGLKRSLTDDDLSSYLRVLPTKLQPPRIRLDSVPRTGLVKLLQADPGQQIVVIEAPAGYGKSTVAAQWLAATDVPTAWISLDEGDNDPNRFFGVIVAALQSIDQEIGRRAFDKMSGNVVNPGTGIIDALIEDLSMITRPCAVILDDFHTLTEHGLLQSIAVLLRNLPSPMRVFILGRSSPALPLARFRARGDLLELTFNDLRFSDTEARDLLNSEQRIDLTAQEVLLLNQRTEGWPAGLRLAWHAMKGLPRERIRSLVEEFSGQLGPIENFLWEEALESLPERQARFLRNSAVFDRFCADLYDAVFETDDAAELIQALDAGNLFIISLDTRGEWYRYHHLFRDVLRHRLVREVSEDEITRFHRRAAEWYQEQGSDDDAIRHALAGRDWDRAVALLEPIARQLYRLDHVASLRARLEVLPQSVLDNHPELSFFLAWATTRAGRVALSLRPMAAAERAWRASGDSASLGRLEALRAFQLAVGSDFPRAIAHAGHALELLPPESAVERALSLTTKANMEVLAGLPNQAETTLGQSHQELNIEQESGIWHLDTLTVGTILASKGKLNEAAVMLRRAVRSEYQARLIQVQHGLGHLGMIYYEQNALEEAEQCFYRAIRLSDESGIRLWRGRSHFGLARVAHANGDDEAAFAEIEEALRIWEEVGSPNEIGKARALQARIRLDANQLSLVRHWFDRVDLNPFAHRSTFERHFELVTYARFLIAQGDQFEVVFQLLDRLRHDAIASGRFGDLVELDMLRAIALRGVDDTAGSVAALEAALERGESEGYRRVFVDEGERVAPILRHFTARGRFRDYARNLLSVIDDSWSLPSPAQAGLIESLSEREIQVLRLVAIGLPNRAIGDRLFITEGTVKKHLSSILGKLQVSNRTQAIDQARRMGLLSD